MRRPNVSRVVSEALCCKPVEPHWTVCQKPSEAPSSFRPKTKQSAAQRASAPGGEASGGCCQAQLAGLTLSANFAMKLKGVLIVDVEDSWESFQISKRISKVYYLHQHAARGGR